MKAPGFWWTESTHPAARLLAPASAVWGRVASRRMNEKPEMIAPVPVICIGNFVAGGAGKTPTALAVAKLAQSLGFHVGFLTRGYGGETAARPRLVNPAEDRASRVGDEPLLLAAVAPTVVSPDRKAGAQRLLAEGVELIVMDDGFQNPTLAKDLALVVVDGSAGIGNGRVTPAGPLRAPLDIQLHHASAVLVIGAGPAGEAVARRAAEAGKKSYRARLRPRNVDQWRGGAFLAYAGIGRPEKFFASLRETGASVAMTVAFPDHHRFTDADARRLLERAASDGLRLVTTEKDHARLRGEGSALGELFRKTGAFAVDLEFERRADIAALIQKASAAAKRRGR